jgi:LacI family transcriptional regulator
MKKRPTIGDIARKAGVSDTTVSLAYVQGSRISKETRQRVLKIAKSLNYFPNNLARDLRYGQSKTIGFVVTDITDPFYSRMIRSAERISLKLGYNILFAEHNWEPNREIEIISNLIGNRAVGVIMCFSEKTKESLNLIEQTNLHLVAVDTIPSFYRGPYVINDLFEAGRMAAEHLVEVGCKQPIFFNSDDSMANFSSFQFMLRGFRDFLRAQQIAFDNSSVFNAGFDIEGGVKGFIHLMDSGKSFDGIFCVNDLCAIGAMEAAEKNGYKTGKNLAIMGIDNIELSSVSRISLTSIDQPYDKIIKMATEALIESIEQDKTCTIKEKLKPILVVRDSTKLEKSK